MFGKKHLFFFLNKQVETIYKSLLTHCSNVDIKKNSENGFFTCQKVPTHFQNCGHFSISFQIWTQKAEDDDPQENSIFEPEVQKTRETILSFSIASVSKEENENKKSHIDETSHCFRSATGSGYAKSW